MKLFVVHKLNFTDWRRSQHIRLKSSKKKSADNIQENKTLRSQSKEVFQGYWMKFTKLSTIKNFKDDTGFKYRQENILFLKFVHNYSQQKEKLIRQNKQNTFKSQHKPPNKFGEKLC